MLSCSDDGEAVMKAARVAGGLACLYLDPVRIHKSYMDGDEHTYVLQSHYEQPPAGGDQGANKLHNISPHKWCASCACVTVCVCVCVFVRFCHTHELHPVLIKAGCSFYIITEFAFSRFSYYLCLLLHNPAPSHSPPCYSFLLLSFPL